MDRRSASGVPSAPREYAEYGARAPQAMLAGETSLQWRALLRGDLRQGIELAQKASQFLRAQRQLRACTRTGRYVRVQGRVFVYNRGRITVGERTVVLGTVAPCELRAYPGAELVIGARAFLNYGVSISAHDEVRIGADCLIGHYTRILDNSYHDVVDHRKLPRSKPVIIGDDVWIGSHAIILPGVSIGDGACVGAGAVVRESVPPRAIVIGNPAQIVSFVEANPPQR
jgi:carbonic anhydrase/acetyltransferase-like protein (isoleucine patch superfamily)